MRPVQAFVQFLIIGLGAGATYALFAQGAVLIYRGSGLVNFAQGAIGTFAAYIAFVDLDDRREWATLPAILVAVVAGGVVSLVFQAIVLRALRRAAPIVRVIATIGLLGLLQAVVAKRYGVANRPVDSYLPDDVFQWGDIVIQEERIYLVGITLVITAALWAWTRYTRVGLAIGASAQNERAVQTLGWSPGSPGGAHLDDRRHARRVGGGARRSAHGSVGDHLHHRGDRRRSRRRAARRLPVVPAHAARRSDHRRRRGDGHALRQRHHRSSPTRTSSPG